MNRRTLARGLSDFGLLTSTVFGFAVTHVPTPRGVGTSEQDGTRIAVRGVWDLVKRFAIAASETGVSIPDWLADDKVIHVALYVLPGMFSAVSLAFRRRGIYGMAVLWGIWAAFDELTQGLIGREVSGGDIVANILGAGIGMGVGWVGVWVGRRRRSPR